MRGMQALDSTEEPIPAAVKAKLKAKVELLVRKVTTQQKAAAAAKQVLSSEPRCQSRRCACFGLAAERAGFAFVGHPIGISAAGNLLDTIEITY